MNVKLESRRTKRTYRKNEIRKRNRVCFHLLLINVLIIGWQRTWRF